MTTRWTLLFACPLFVFSTGCATIAQRDGEKISIETEPPGAVAIAQVSREQCTTPCKLLVLKTAPVISIVRDGYRPTEVHLEAQTWRTGIAGSIAGNLLLGAGMVVAGGLFTIYSDTGDELVGGLTLLGSGIYVGLGGGFASDVQEHTHKKLRPNRLHIVLEPSPQAPEPAGVFRE